MSTPLPRDQFPVAKTWTYLNHATICAPPRPAVDAADAHLRDAMTTGGIGFMDRVAGVRPVREALAALAGVDPGGIALTKNTTEGLAWLAWGAGFGPGDRVLIPADDFPSTRLPFAGLRRVGVRVEEVRGEDGRIPLDVWAAALDEAPTTLVVASWVHSNRGHRTDLAALADVCHQRGSLLIADVIQGLGVVPCRLAEWGVDGAACGSHKWLLAPEGIGFLWAGPALAARLEPMEEGWRWMGDDPSEQAYQAPAGTSLDRLEGGTLNGTGLAALGGSLGLLHEAGIEEIWRHVDGLCDHLVERLETLGLDVRSDRSPTARSAIVSVAVPDAVDMAERASADGLVVSARGGAVRISPHGWNSRDEIDAVVDFMASRPR